MIRIDPGARMQSRVTPLAGIGLKPCHAGEVLAHGSTADFFEVHAENYMVRGGPYLEHLDKVRERWPLSIHGVGLSIGGEGRLDDAHVDALVRLLQRFQPRWFSEHLAWSTHGGFAFNDLLPLAYDTATLVRVCDHIDEAQSRLGRTLLLENPGTYVEFEASTMAEPQILSEVVRRTGCGLLLDVNNLYVSAVNHNWDPWRYFEDLPQHAIAEIHLAGFAEDRGALGERLLIDSHGAAVDRQVWLLYGRVIEKLGPVPTLIERDNNIPALAILEQEAGQARTIQCNATRRCTVTV